MKPLHPMVGVPHQWEDPPPHPTTTHVSLLLTDNSRIYVTTLKLGPSPFHSTAIEVLWNGPKMAAHEWKKGNHKHHILFP